MDGEELYARYAALQDRMSNCTVETWPELDHDEQRVWRALAEDITEEHDAAFEGYRE